MTLHEQVQGPVEHDPALVAETDQFAEIERAPYEPSDEARSMISSNSSMSCFENGALNHCVHRPSLALSVAGSPSWLGRAPDPGIVGPVDVSLIYGERSRIRMRESADELDRGSAVERRA